MSSSRSWKVWLCAVAIAGAAMGGVPAAGAAPTVPGAPKLVSAQPGHLSIVVAFKAPVSDGGSEIFDYRITCTSGNGGAEAIYNGIRSPITVLRATAGKKYTCRIKAENQAGFGPSSLPSAEVVPLSSDPKTLPDPPKQVSVRAEIGAIKVSFVGVGTSGGTRVTGYLAVCTSSNGGPEGRKKRSSSPITVSHLLRGKTYTCRVSSRNPVGYGPLSTPSSEVVPLGPHSVPDPPTRVASTAGVRRVTVTFKKPANDGGERIDLYRATCTSSDGGVTGSENGTKSPITVGNLSKSKTYTCTVAARSRMGLGAASAPSNAVVTLAS